MKIELNLSEETETALKLKAARGGLTASELLSAFVHDLVCGEESQGSDERMYADNWYERCYFTHVPADDFYTWLARHYELEAALDDWSALKCMEENDLPGAEDEEEAADIIDSITWRENNIKGRYQEYGGSGDWREEMSEAAKKWDTSQ